MGFYGPIQTEAERALGIKGVIEGYGCVRCQRYHYEGDELFGPHIGWQSKHGIERFRAETVADARAARATENPNEQEGQ